VAIPAFQPINPVGNFLAGQQAATQQTAEQQQNALRATQLSSAQNINALSQNPNATPEQYIRAGDPQTGNALAANQQQAQQQKQQALGQLGTLASKALEITDPQQRKAFISQAAPAYGNAFAALGVDHNQGLAQLESLPDATLEQRLKQVAQYAPDEKPVTVDAGASLVQPTPGGGAKTLFAGAPKPTNDQLDYGAAQKGGFSGSFLDYQRTLKDAAGDNKPMAVIGPDGKPVYVRASAAVGKQPYSPSVFGASSVSDDAVQFAADTYRTTGKFPGSFGRSPALQARVLDRVASDAIANGDTAGAITARTASLKANGQALDQVTKLETATNGYAATLDKNLTNLTQSYSKLDSSGSPLINRAVRAWQQGVSGDPQTADMVTWLNAVQGEYAKLKSGNLGNAPASDAAMRDAKEVINKNMSEGDARRSQNRKPLSPARWVVRRRE
jgi:hypothetical protein